MITTSTHHIYAYYLINDDFKAHDLPTYGDNLEEIIAEMIDFASGMPGLAAPFEVASDTRTGDEFKVIIKGEAYRTDEDGDFTDETDTVTIVIAGWEK
ncbi:hypothetical protein SEA_DARWIN_97 [Corynebacterium phage Darwin]|uniref:Uncharacterized protein n=1 Tax=Corynebacterium phage Darwin TaxID=2047869 RepID=A0A2H4P8Y0_9CAUD|nr:hypothetical protein FDJ11_gp51 [Corynebacterium phage Darwin]ATW58549.1 hypothetical protein SEA_DARWIN_97 [Corynebacterium phage Darwin]